MKMMALHKLKENTEIMKTFVITTLKLNIFYCLDV